MKKEAEVVEQRKVIARFLYDVGVPVIRLFDNVEKAQSFAHREGDHLKSMEILNK